MMIYDATLSRKRVFFSFFLRTLGGFLGGFLGGEVGCLMLGDGLLLSVA